MPKKKPRARANEQPAVDTSTEKWWEVRRTRDAFSVILLVVVSLAFFAPIHFQGKRLYGGDTVNWKATAQSVLEYRESTGEEPLWAANTFGGMPAYMISYPPAVPNVDSLLRQLRVLLWPSAHLFILLLGVFVLVRWVTGRPFAALLSAVAFGFTTYLSLILVAGHNSKFVALAYAPWMILAFTYLLKRPTLLASLIFAVAVAVNLRASHVQITYYVLFGLGVWWVWSTVSSVREKDRAIAWKRTGLLVLGGVIGLMMVAQPYLSVFEYKQYSIRGAGGSGGLALDYAMGWSQGIGELVTLIIADAYGGGSAYWGPKQFTAGPHYVGGLVVLLAVVGIVRNRSVMTRSLAAAAGLMVLFSLGENFALLNEAMFHFFPFFNSFRVPETWLSTVALLLAILAGIGAAELLDELKAHSGGLWSLRSVRVAVVLVGAVAVLWVGRDQMFSFEREGEADRIAAQIAQANSVRVDDPRIRGAVEDVQVRLAEDRRAAFDGDAVRTLLFLLAGLGAIALASRRTLPFSLLPMILALLVLADLWSVDRRYLNEDRMQTAGTLEDQVIEYGFDRFLMEKAEEEGGEGSFRVLSLEGNPTVTARPSYFHESIGGYHGAKLRLIQDFFDELMVGEDGRLNPLAMRLMDVEYVIGTNPPAGFVPVFGDDRTGLTVFADTLSPGRAFLVDEVVELPSDAAVMAAIRSNGFDPRQAAATTEDIAISDEAPAFGSSKVNVFEHGPRRIAVQVETESTRLLVLSEVYYPAGWTARVDDQPTPIHRVNHLLRGVVVPAGSHEVVFEFEPQSHRIGVMLAGASTGVVYLLIVLLGVAEFRRRRSPKGRDAGPQG
jgi:hypothetical protein